MADCDNQDKKWTALAEPVEGHRRLQPFAGTFRAAVQVFMGPEAPPFESSGTMVSTWELGGRYLRQDYISDDRRMKGVGFWGFNRAANEYEAIWMDVMSTGMMITKGNCDSGGKVFTSQATMPSPSGGGMMLHIRTVATIVSEDEHTYENYMRCGDAPEFRSLSIRYTRSG